MLKPPQPKLTQQEKDINFQRNTKLKKDFDLTKPPWINKKEHYTKENWDELHKKQSKCTEKK